MAQEKSNFACKKSKELSLLLVRFLCGYLLALDKLIKSVGVNEDPSA